MLPIRNVTCTKCYLYKMLPIPNVTIRKCTRQNVTIRKCTIRNVTDPAAVLGPQTILAVALALTVTQAAPQKANLTLNVHQGSCTFGKLPMGKDFRKSTPIFGMKIDVDQMNLFMQDMGLVLMNMLRSKIDIVLINMFRLDMGVVLMNMFIGWIWGQF